jgi:hypothetical protein
MSKGTLSFSNLGSYGHLGNQLFQIASTMGIALENEMDYMFPTWKYDKYFIKSIPQMDKKELDKIKGEYIDREGPHHFQPLLIIDNKRNWDIGGYLQSEKYFEENRDEVLSYFEFKDEYVSYLKKQYEEILEMDNICALHVRRGDYLNFPAYHPTCDMNYYNQAMSHFSDDTKFIVFSNDLDWCRANFRGNRFIFIDECDKTNNGDVMLEFILMTMCKNNITANSTFSLWAAILNKNENKKIISPSRWFGPALQGYILSDMYSKNAIII